MLPQVTRWVLKNEVMPTRLLWWMAADAMGQWYRMLRGGLAEALGGKPACERVLARLAAPVYQRHYDALAARHPALPGRDRDPAVVGLLLGSLTRLAFNPRARFMFTCVGGGPAGPADHLRAELLLRHLPVRERWEEVTTHLGEVLIALTRGLPAEGLTQANALLGRLCFDGGVKYASQMQRAFDLPRTPQSAIEVLRTSEYIFRVNPEHWSAADAAAHTGYLEGTACPWYTADGWSMMHCGVFGQFQSGISSVFGLRYQLTTTIPKHGGHTCRVDLRPVPPTRHA
jgi:hypothetical protein